MGVAKEGFTSIHTLIQGDLSKWTVNHIQQGENQFWRLYYSLNPGDERKVDEIEIGRIPNVTSSIRLTREKIWWLFTRQNDGVALPRNEDTIVLLAKIETETQRSTKHARYVCFIPLVTNAIVGTLRGENDIVLARFEHEAQGWGFGEILVSLGSNPISLLKATVAYQQTLFPSAPIPLAPGQTDRSSELYKGTLTYCTWNSLQPPVECTSTSMLETLKSFPLVPNNLLIDDGWQTVDSGQLVGYGPNLHWLDGHNSLKDVIQEIKALGVERVGVWHTGLGYWGGFSRNSELFKDLPFLTLKGVWGNKYPILHFLQINEFFDKWYQYLSESGVDFVKCDDMAEIENMESCTDDQGQKVLLRIIRTAYVGAIRYNVNKWFSGRIIWCMAHSPRHLLGWHALSTSNAIRPMRSSDDYFPHIPASHAYHIYTNIVASQFLSCFSIPDFDMFQTHAFVGGDTNLPPQGGFHGSLRALGNGPVTITDVMNHCDKDVFMKLAGKGKHGTIALNAENPLELLDDRCFDNVAQRGDGMGIRGYSKSEWGIMMGIWNVREDGGLVKDSVSMEDVAFAFGSRKVLCWSHRQQALFRLPDHPPDKFTLKELEFEILTLVEIRDQPVCLGLIDKYNTLAAIEARIGNKWRFKCAGSAVFVLPGPDEFVPMIEAHRVSAETWRVGEYTVMKVDLQEHASLYPDADSLWSIHLCYN